jgi:hypothetical protein
LILGLLVGALDVETARARGLQIDGEIATIRRVQPTVSPAGGEARPKKRSASKRSSSPARR